MLDCFFPTATGRKKRVKGASALKELEAKRAAKRARIDKAGSEKVKVVKKEESEVDSKDDKNGEPETAMETDAADGIFHIKFITLKIILFTFSWYQM